jgi:hypothetical protein
MAVATSSPRTEGADVFFVEARYHRSPERAAGQVRYIAHREEGLTDGRQRELYGLASAIVPSAATSGPSGGLSARTVEVSETRSTFASS